MAFLVKMFKCRKALSIMMPIGQNKNCRSKCLFPPILQQVGWQMHDYPSSCSLLQIIYFVTLYPTHPSSCNLFPSGWTSELWGAWNVDLHQDLYLYSLRQEGRTSYLQPRSLHSFPLRPLPHHTQTYGLVSEVLCKAYKVVLSWYCLGNLH